VAGKQFFKFITDIQISIKIAEKVTMENAGNLIYNIQGMVCEQVGPYTALPFCLNISLRSTESSVNVVFVYVTLDSVYTHEEEIESVERIYLKNVVR
jgi:hypothetical protein